MFSKNIISKTRLIGAQKKTLTGNPNISVPGAIVANHLAPTVGTSVSFTGNIEGSGMYVTGSWCLLSHVTETGIY